MELSATSGSTLTFNSTVTGKNQVTIPAEIARLFKIEPGVKLEWNAQTGQETIVIKRLRSREELVAHLEGIGRDWKTNGSDPIAELIQERIQDDREEGLW